MKKIILFSMMLIISASSFSQQTNPVPGLTKQDYLEKSKKQKTTAWIMLGGGVALAGAGVVWASSNFNSSGPDVLFVLGGVSMIGSIPFFIASGKNKRKGMSMSFKNEIAPQIQKSSFVYRPLPSLTLKINL